MGNCLGFSFTDRTVCLNARTLPIDTIFKLPSPLPEWQSGAGFGRGAIDLGGLQVRKVSSFTKVWTVHEGGPDNLGATFFEPSSLPEGFFMLGCYSQPNNKSLNGWVLVGKDNEGGTLAKPVDYTLVWSTESLKIKRDGNGYVWLPIPPEGYTPVGHIFTASPTKPSLEKIWCVRSDFTEECVVESWIWGPGRIDHAHGFGVYGLKPRNRGTHSLAVSVGTFFAKNGHNKGSSSLPISCLKNKSQNLTACMPDLSQINSLVQAYSPLVYFHPHEKYLPSSVTWYFTNQTLLYKQGEKPVPIEADGSNLPQGCSNDDTYWLGLPLDRETRKRVKKGDLQKAEAYYHIKHMYGATFTDIAIWLFYPFNGPSTGKLGLVNLPLGKIGEHVGDWEHVTLRISNFNGELWSVYFSQHGTGSWVNASELEFIHNSNKFAVYASLKGHASYPKPGLVLDGSGALGIGIRNDTAKGGLSMDTGGRFKIVAAEHLRGSVTSPPWLNYMHRWGPKVRYVLEEEEIKLVEGLLPWPLNTAFKIFVSSLPRQVFAEEGPVGPKAKSNWGGDEA